MQYHNLNIVNFLPYSNENKISGRGCLESYMKSIAYLKNSTLLLCGDQILECNF